MKKRMILVGVITLLVGTGLFARGLNKMEMNHNNGNNYAFSTQLRRGEYQRHCHNGRGVRFKQNKEIEANRTIIMEKRVELRKEMLKDTPDWNKIEELNQEIASKRASNHTIMMRDRVTNLNGVLANS